MEERVAVKLYRERVGDTKGLQIEAGKSESLSKGWNSKQAAA
jgi:hypothetical protein